MKIKVKETKETEFVTEEEYETCNTEFCMEEYYDNGEYCPTPLEIGFRQWKERRRICAKESTAAVNLTEEFLYSCLPDGHKSCFQV